MTGFNLFKEMEQVTREMDDLFRGLGFATSPSPAVGRYPRMNLREEQEHFVVEAQLPGVDPKELEMSILKGVLTLSGERREVMPQGATWHRRERGRGKFLRAIDIPVEVDVERVRADFRDGVLTVTLPKAESERPRRIAIEAG